MGIADFIIQKKPALVSYWLEDLQMCRRSTHLRLLDQ